MEEHDLFKKIKQIELVASRLVDSFLSGSYRSVFKGQGIELADVREYEAGDDIRLIDWNVYSRMGNPYTKVFREERELSIFLVVDCSASLFSGIGARRKSEICALVFALLGISSVLNNDRMGCVFFSDRIERWVPPRAGKRHVLRIIADLMKISPSGKGSDLRLALLSVGKFLKRRSVCIVISDFKTEGFLHELSIVARKHDCIAIRIACEPDLPFPVTGVVELEEPETGEIVLAPFGAGSFQNAYKKYWSSSWNGITDELARRNVEIIEIYGQDDPGRKLMEFFERRKRRWRL